MTIFLKDPCQIRDYLIMNIFDNWITKEVFKPFLNFGVLLDDVLFQNHYLSKLTSCTQSCKSDPIADQKLLVFFSEPVILHHLKRPSEDLLFLLNLFLSLHLTLQRKQVLKQNEALCTCFKVRVMPV